MIDKHQFALDRITERYKHEEKLDKNSKFVVLYKSIKACILNFELPHQWTLPSTRMLASSMNLSRTTVLKTYELLMLEKLIISKAGSGYKTYYNPEEGKISENKTNPFTQHNYPSISEKGLSYSKNIALINRDINENLAFRPGLPPIDIFPINRWKNLINNYWSHVKASGLGYSQSSGLEELKKSISRYLNISRNIKCHSDQIVIVSGTLQSLYLVVNTLLEKGDSVVVENPLFPNVHSILKSSQSKLIPIGLDQEGLDINALNEQTNCNPKLIHVTPSNQYPLGIKMSLNRRKELLAWASNKGALILENDYENEISNQQNPLPTLFSLDTEDRTIYMGTFNRLLHPSIRLGYMLVPKYLKPAVEALQEHSHRFVSPSIQLVMQQFIEKNYLYQHVKNCIEVAQERFQLFNSEFENNIENMTLQNIDFSSFHRLAFFNNTRSPKEELGYIKKLNENGIKAFSLSKCYIGTPEKTGLILGYAAVPPSVIKQKIQVMGKIL